MKNILILVDDVPLRSKILEVLNLEIFHTISAKKTSEWLGLVKEQYPDLIITDLDARDSESYELLKQFRQLTFFKDTPIILLTKQIEEEFCFQVWQLGISLYFLKTVDLYFLSQVIFLRLKQKY
ncbi:MAG: response regulator [Gomphosphaeria aponina SAG 52.96 = DSM 107014]|uniref:Response regulator n=1 Tax=Gomphosphaeria aponina SAG 52.96 = DSM 107014 TaxID=1521640 RepID=A0A941GV36_9CHRO|nr:response regulator [Gomphosphaeria aponina SAG 52.96 = DSM 107014]